MNPTPNTMSSMNTHSELESKAIELKRQKGGRASPEQREWLKTLAQHGFASAICNGADDAIQFIEETIKK